MATTIVTKNSSTAAAVPTAAQLVQGELAVNVADKRLYTEDNGGAIVELGVNPATEITANAGIALPDSQKATFGAGDDLQIYHDGFNTLIKESGAGSLLIDATNTYFRNAAGTKDYAWMVDGGAVSLFYNNSNKLTTTSTGIDVTGTATMDGLTVDGASEIRSTFDATLNITSTAGTVSSGNVYGSLNFVTEDGSVANDRKNAATIQAINSGGSGSYCDLDFYTSAGTGAANSKSLKIAANGDISFYEDTGTTPKFVWDASAESLTLGSGGSEGTLNVGGAASSIVARFTDATTSSVVVRPESGGAIIGTDGGGTLHLASNGSTLSDRKMTILASGNVGIGTSSPDGILDIEGNFESQKALVLTNTQGTGKVSYLRSHGLNGEALSLYHDGNRMQAWESDGSIKFEGSGSERMRIDSSGNVGIGTSSPDHILCLEGAEPTLRIFDSANTLNQEQTIAFGTEPGNRTHAEIAGINTNTGNASGSLSFKTNSGSSVTERMRIDSAGNVGIGSGNPQNKLDIEQSAAVSARLLATGATSSSLKLEVKGGATQLTTTEILANSGGTLTFATGTTSSSERMRIDSSGNLLVGTTSTTNGGHVLKIASGTVSTVETDVTTVINMIVFRNGNGNVGTIQTNGSTTSYNTSSDQRLKENIADADDAGSKIDAIQVRKYDWKADGSHQDYGMIAQELVEVAPEAVSVPEDSEEMMGVDYSKLVPMLIKEIQSLRNRVAQLETGE